MQQFMNGFFKNIKEDRLIFRGFILTFAIVILSVLYIFLYYKRIPPLVPLFNQMPWGEERIARKIWIFSLPILSFVIFVFNLGFSSLVYKKNPLIPRLLVVTSFLISILTLLFLVRTIQVAL